MIRKEFMCGLQFQYVHLNTMSVVRSSIVGGLWWVAAWSAVSGPERTAGMTVREDGKLPIPVGDSHLPLSRRHELDGRQTLGHD